MVDSARVFEDVHLEWDGRRYTIPHDRMMAAIGRIEQHLTMEELGRYRERNTIPLGALASAFAAILRFAGAGDLRDVDVYGKLFAAEGIAARDMVMTAVTALLAIMVPPSAVAARMEAAPAKKPNRQRRRAAAKLSRKRSS